MFSKNEIILIPVHCTLMSFQLNPKQQIFFRRKYHRKYIILLLKKTLLIGKKCTLYISRFHHELALDVRDFRALFETPNELWSYKNILH